MSRTAGPSRAFRTRDFHRRALTLHFFLFLAGMATALWANREYSPDAFWAQWVALGWGVVLLGHGVVFARSTLSTMGGGR